MLHNAGDVALSRVFVRVYIPPEIENSISDFYFAPNLSVPPASFLETLAHSESPSSLQLAEKMEISPITDDHSQNRTLYDLDHAFDRILTADLKTTAEQALKDLQNSGGRCDDWHYIWLNRCVGSQSPPSDCERVNRALGTWEHTKRSVQTNARKKWHEATGVAVIPSGRQLSPNGVVYFVLSLGADESGFLGLRFGPESLPLAQPNIYSNPQRKAIVVDRQGDLFASSLSIFWRYYPYWMIFWTLLIVTCVALVWPLIRPASLLSTHKVFNLALKTNDPAHWELASQRHKFNIFGIYRLFWDKFKQTEAKHSPDEIFDFIKSCSLDEREDSPFENVSDLNRFIRRKLGQLTRLP